MTLRPYQQRAVDEIRRHAARGGTGVILQMATGAGKTKCFTNVLAGAYAKGKTGIMVVRGKALVQQASDRLARDGVPHGIYQGGNTTRQNEPIMVCSVDTLYRRQVAPRADILVIDEVHLSHSDSYRWLLSHETYAKTFKLGVSATPHHKDGMRHVADKLIMPATMADLIAQGFLVGGRYFVPYVPDLRGVKKTSGDFNGKELNARSEGDAELTANAAKVWARCLRGKRTLVYATGLGHAAVLAAALAAEGARLATVDASTPDAERRRVIAALEAQELDLLVSVGVLTTGVDIPPLEAIVCCRPTKSYNLWIQIMGRGTRPSPGKTSFELYDLSGNLIEHGPIEAEMLGSLDAVPEKPPRQALVLCPACYAMFTPVPACPECGAPVGDAKPRQIGEARAHGLTGTDEVVEKIVEPWELTLPALVERARERQLKKGWIYHSLKEKFGEEAANKAWNRIRPLKQWPVKARASTPLP